MSYTSSPIHDYITLGFKDGVIDGHKLHYNIPQSAYMSDSRADYVLVSVADTVFHDITQLNPVCITCNLSRNSYATTQNLTGIISSYIRVAGTSGDSNCSHYVSNDTVKFLTNARPSFIELKGHKVTNVSGFNDLALVTGYVTLKFEYISKDAVKEIESEVRYLEAFPSV